ncbi:MAG: formylglycine-generating enzyme family protein [Lentisphaerae bacterium]|nr:formylglycine-generating enzyme family protein [Lentisphaerota bacterium]
MTTTKGRRLLWLAALFVCATFVGARTAEGSLFFRLVSPTNTAITAFSLDGTITWTNAATAGVTCSVQRAVTLTGPGNWVDFVRHEATNTAVSLRVFDPATPAGMAFIPAGVFEMGDALAEGETDEVPVHTVYTDALYMDQAEVSKALWLEVRDWSKTNDYDLYLSQGDGRADNQPVHTVTWYEAVAWCNARSEREGLTPCYYTSGGAVFRVTLSASYAACDWSANGYRLPTEAEWERAARGGPAGMRFPWGETISHDQANYVASSSIDVYDINGYDGYFTNGIPPYTTPIRWFAASGYDVHDMIGNVWEWCWDYYDVYSPDYASNPVGPPSSWDGRVLRGGSWEDSAWGVRVARRQYLNPEETFGVIGFRTVRRIPE